MVPDLLTSEWAGTHNFRGIAKFHKCFEKSGTSASIWAMCKASIFKIVRLAATWKNFRCGHEKMLKTDVFHKTLISRNLLKEAHIQARSMWKLTSRAFRKCGTYWAYQVLNGSYCWSKSDGFEILAPLAKIRSRKKKETRPQFCDLGPEIESACNQPCFFYADSISGPKTQNCGRVFFFYGSFSINFFLKIWPDFDSQ